MNFHLWCVVLFFVFFFDDRSSIFNTSHICIPNRPFIVVSVILFRFQKVAALPQILTMHHKKPCQNEHTDHALKPREFGKLVSTSGTSSSISPEITEVSCPSEEIGLSNFLQVVPKKRNGNQNPHTVNSWCLRIHCVMEKKDKAGSWTAR